MTVDENLDKLFFLGQLRHELSFEMLALVTDHELQFERQAGSLTIRCRPVFTFKVLIC